MFTPKLAKRAPVFSSEAIRLLVGCITFTLPIVVLITSAFTPLTSISAAYYTGARDIFVGLVFVLGAFLFVYKGHTPKEGWMANLGTLAAVGVTLCPTACDSCPADWKSNLHLLAGALLFIVAGYFCLGPFTHAAKGKNWPEARRRVKLYSFCGFSIFVCLGVLAFVELAITAEVKATWALVFWGEVFMLWLFSAAWFAAAKCIPAFTSKDEQLDVSKELQLDVLNLPQYLKK